MPPAFALSLVQIGSLTVGKDAICRLFQYSCKFSSWLSNTLGNDSNHTQMLKDLEWSISTSRKLFRIGKSAEFFLLAQKELNKNGTGGFLNCIDKITSGIYLLCDHMVWLARMKLFRIQEKYWNQLAAKFWILSLMMSMLRTIYMLIVAFQKSSRRTDLADCMRIVAKHSDVLLDCVKNFADLLIPLNTLDVVSVPSGVVGFVGIVTSLIRMYFLWKKSK